MSPASSRRLKRLAITAAIAIGCGAAPAFALDPGCDDITKVNQPRIKPNSTVDVFFNPAIGAPQAFVQGLQGAIAELSGKIDGITLRLVPDENDDNASIIVNVGNTHPTAIGNYSGRLASDGSLATGILNIYQNQASCGGRCLDPAAANYVDAIKWVFMHELLHALGADHSQKANIMYPDFAGKNGIGNPAANLPCVLPKVQSLLSSGAGPTTPGTCG